MKMSRIRMENLPVLNELIGGLLDVVFPPRCCYCGAGLKLGTDAGLCCGCLVRVRCLEPPICLCCGTKLDADGGSENRYCGGCLKQRPFFDKARSLYFYEPPLSSLIHRLKFHGSGIAAAALADLVARDRPGTDLRDVDLIIPVPLHSARLRDRGLNQSLVIARLAFPRDGKRIEPMVLVRKRETVAQTGLSGKERRKNLRGAFAVNERQLIRGRSVLLVDDVYTTGSTVMECSKTLKRAGAARVEVLTLARALKNSKLS